MPTATNWLNSQQKIFTIRFIGDWTLSEIRNAFAEANKAISEVEHHIVILFDFTDSHSVPNSLLSSIRSLQQTIPDNLIYAIGFGGDMFMQLMSETIRKVYNQSDNVKYVESYELALQLAYNQLEQFDK